MLIRVGTKSAQGQLTPHALIGATFLCCKADRWTITIAVPFPISETPKGLNPWEFIAEFPSQYLDF